MPANMAGHARAASARVPAGSREELENAAVRLLPWSAAHRRTHHEIEHACPDLVADPPHVVDGLALRIGQRPVLALHAGNRGTRLAAAHRDEHASAPRER